MIEDIIKLVNKNKAQYKNLKNTFIHDCVLFLAVQYFDIYINNI